MAALRRAAPTGNRYLSTAIPTFEQIPEVLTSSVLPLPEAGVQPLVQHGDDWASPIPPSPPVAGQRLSTASQLTRALVPLLLVLLVPAELLSKVNVMERIVCRAVDTQLGDLASLLFLFYSPLFRLSCFFLLWFVALSPETLGLIISTGIVRRLTFFPSYPYPCPYFHFFSYALNPSDTSFDGRHDATVGCRTVPPLSALPDVGAFRPPSLSDLDERCATLHLGSCRIVGGLYFEAIEGLQPKGCILPNPSFSSTSSFNTALSNLSARCVPSSSRIGVIGDVRVAPAADR